MLSQLNNNIGYAIWCIIGIFWGLLIGIFDKVSARLSFFHQNIAGQFHFSFFKRARGRVVKECDS